MLDANMTNEQIRLQFGELSSGEIRLVRAIIKLANGSESAELASLRAENDELKARLAEVKAAKERFALAFADGALCDDDIIVHALNDFDRALASAPKVLAVGDGWVHYGDRNTGYWGSAMHDQRSHDDIPVRVIVTERGTP